MSIVAVTPDLMLYSRIHAAATAAGAEVRRVDGPDGLPAATEVDLALVDWSERTDGWGESLAAWRASGSPRLILYGRHTDIESHRAAKALGLGPMWARSKLVAELDKVVRGR